MNRCGRADGGGGGGIIGCSGGELVCKGGGGFEHGGKKSNVAAGSGGGGRALGGHSVSGGIITGTILILRPNFHFFLCIQKTKKNKFKKSSLKFFKSEIVLSIRE